MKRKIALYITLMLLISTSVYAVSEFRSGTVEYIRVHDDSIGPTWEVPVFWFSLKGVTTAGTCKTWHGRALFVADTHQAYSMVLAMYTSGKPLAIRFDDSFKNEYGYCKVKYITAGDPAPEF